MSLSRIKPKIKKYFRCPYGLIVEAKNWENAVQLLGCDRCNEDGDDYLTCPCGPEEFFPKMVRYMRRLEHILARKNSQIKGLKLELKKCMNLDSPENVLEILLHNDMKRIVEDSCPSDYGYVDTNWTRADKSKGPGSCGTQGYGSCLACFKSKAEKMTDEEITKKIQEESEESFDCADCKYSCEECPFGENEKGGEEND